MRRFGSASNITCRSEELLARWFHVTTTVPRSSPSHSLTEYFFFFLNAVLVYF